MTAPTPNQHPPRRLMLLAGAAVLVAGAAGVLWPRAAALPDPSDPRTTLAQVEDAVARILPLPEITAAELAELLPAGAPLLLLDVREPAEFAQSRIPGAVRIAPGAPAAELLARHGAAMLARRGPGAGRGAGRAPLRYRLGPAAAPHPRRLIRFASSPAPPR